MEALDDVLWWEDFYYYGESGPAALGYVHALDYFGQVETTDGWVQLPGRAGFALAISDFDGNPDNVQPYAKGVPSPGYLLFPVLGGDAVSGVVIHPWTSAAATLTFSMSFSGSARDKIYLLVRPQGGAWATRQVITNAAGFPWGTYSVSLPAGFSDMALVIKTASSAPGDYVQPPGTLGQPAPGSGGQAMSSIDHRLRITALRFTHPNQAPVATGGPLYYFPQSTTLTVNASVGRFAALSATQETFLLTATVVSPHFDLLADSTLSVKTEAGAEMAHLDVLAETFLVTVASVTALSVSATGGFMIGSTARMSVESTLLPEVTDAVNPLFTTTLAMKRPAIVHGRPVQPNARSTSRSVTTTQSGQVLGRINPYSVQHRYPGIPVAVTSPTGTLGQGRLDPDYRWLSIDAQRDPVTRELISWPAHQDNINSPAGPAWTTPDGYRPQVENYVMRTDARHEAINYPAVSFDSSKGDHLNITLPAGGDWNDECTWFLVGSFTRYRGALRDSCPILDFTGTAPIDYTTEATIGRGDYRFAQENSAVADDHPGIDFYTGWTAYSDTDPAVSMLSVGRTTASNQVPYVDNSPVVLAISNSGVMVTTIVGTGPGMGRVFVETTRFPFNPHAGERLSARWSLAKSKFVPPFGGLNQTGSMSLLETAFYNTDIGLGGMSLISNYLAGVYAPASLLEPREAYENPSGWGSSTSPLSEELLFSTQSPPQPYWHLHGSQATRVDDDATLDALRAQLAVLYLPLADYESWVANFGSNDMGA